MEARANRLAHHLASAGVGPGDHVGIYALNSTEWVETAWAVFKLRAVWININFRYVEDELRYLFSNADLVALVHQRQFSPRVAALLPELPALAPRDRDRRRQRRARPAPRRRRLRSVAMAAEPERDFAPAVGRRPLHPLHRWDHRHAQGRGVAPAQRLLRPRRRPRRAHRRAHGPAGADGREGPGGGRPAHLPSHRTAHARRHPMGCHGPELRRQPGLSGAEVRSPRGVDASWSARR